MADKKAGPQIEKFRRAVRESGADMTKDEFGRVIGGMAKPKPEKKPESDQPTDDTA